MEYINQNLHFIAIVIMIISSIFSNMKIITNKNTQGLSFRPVFFSLILSMVLIFHADNKDIQLIYIINIVLYLLLFINILYHQKNNIQKNEKDNALLFIIAGVSAFIGINSSAQAYLTYHNKKYKSSVSILANIFLGLQLLIVLYISENLYMQIVTILSILNNIYVITQTFFNNNKFNLT